jgi:hypothetical protein
MDLTCPVHRACEGANMSGPGRMFPLHANAFSVICLAVVQGSQFRAYVAQHELHNIQGAERPSGLTTLWLASLFQMLFSLRSVSAVCIYAPIYAFGILLTYLVAKHANTNIQTRPDCPPPCIR